MPSLQEIKEQEELAEMVGVYLRALRDEPDAVQALRQDAFTLRAVGRRLVGAPLGSKPLLPDAKMHPEGLGLGRERFAQRGLPEPDEQTLRDWLTQSQQGHASAMALRKNMEALERLILEGEIAPIQELLGREPLLPWLMDFSLREYENENLILFAAKYAPPGSDAGLCAYFHALGIRLPQGRLGRLELPAASAMIGARGWKGAQVVGGALLAGGWLPCVEDALFMLLTGADERAGPGAQGVLEQKLDMIDFMRARANIELAARRPEAWVGPNPLDCLGPFVGQGFGLEQALSLNHISPARSRPLLGMLFERMQEWGCDLALLHELCLASSLTESAAVSLPLAQRMILARELRAGITDPMARPTDAREGVKRL